MDRIELIGRDEMLGRLERALGTSPADSTELVWVETGRTEATAAKRRGGEGAAVRERMVLVRVAERGRVGIHVGEACAPRDLEDAVRQALGQARTEPPPAAPPRLATGSAAGAAAPGGFDDELSGLAAGDAGFLLQRLVEREESARLAWSAGRVAVVNSAGLRRAAEVTAATLTVRSGRGAGAGRAAGSARTLAGLGAEAIVERARRRRAEDIDSEAGAEEAEDGPLAPGGLHGSADETGAETAAAHDDPPPARRSDLAGNPAGRSDTGPEGTPEVRETGPAVVLAAEGMARLLDLLAVHALSARSFRDGTSCLVGRLDEPLFDPEIRLVDDGTEAAGLPFPFDLFGFATAPVELIAGGAARTPAVDAGLAAALDRPATPHAVATDDARPGHLFLTPGGFDEAGLFAAATSASRRSADGGGALWIGWLDDVVCDDPKTLRFRARARNVRRIADGALGAAVGDLVWEDSLLRLLARVTGLGTEPVCLAGGDGVFGGTSAPAVAFPAADGLRPAP